MGQFINHTYVSKFLIHLNQCLIQTFYPQSDILGSLSTILMVQNISSINDWYRHLNPTVIRWANHRPYLCFRISHLLEIIYLFDADIVTLQC